MITKINDLTGPEYYKATRLIRLKRLNHTIDEDGNVFINLEELVNAKPLKTGRKFKGANNENIII